MTDTIYPRDFTPEEVAFDKQVRPYTLTSPERILSLRYAVHYLQRRGVPGVIVECGVWMGGSSIAAMLASTEFGDVTQRLRAFWLYDTFNGMTKPEEVDTYDIDGNQLEQGALACSLSSVQANVQRFYKGPVTYVRGPVEGTLPTKAPEQIALLRLDTDWYASTKHALEHLYPRLVPGGVLIVDDYGHWNGARKAVDEFWEAQRPDMLLIRVDYTGRMGVKLT